MRARRPALKRWSQTAYVCGLGGVAAAYLLVGIYWSVLNLGEVPHYGDTPTYFQLAKTLRVDEHRGIVYPWVLAQSVRFFLDGTFPKSLGQPQEDNEVGDLVCAAPGGLVWVQIFQILVCAGSICFFLRMMPSADPEPRALPNRRHYEAPILFLLLLFDPLISHFNMALMTDSLTLSACLLFCGALMALTDLGRRPWLFGAVLGTGFLLAGGLRIEKKWLLFAAFLLASVAWPWMRTLFLARRGVRHTAPLAQGSRRRLLALAVLLGSGLALLVGVQKMVYKESNTLPSFEAFIHFRIGMTHLAELYDKLSEPTRNEISLEDAKQYDSGVNGVRRVVRRLGPRDTPIRREFMQDVAETVLPQRWPGIGRDTAVDALENTFSTISFYAHIATWRLGGWRAIARWFPATGNIWNYQRMIFHHPLLSDLYLGLGALVLVLVMPLSLYLHLRRRPSSGYLRLWAPCLVFVLVNALFFAAAFHYINFRYALFAHVLFLIAVFRPVIRLLLEIGLYRPEPRTNSVS